MTEAVLVVRDALRPPHVIEQVSSDDLFWQCTTCNLTFYRWPHSRHQGCVRELLWRVPWPR